MRWVTRDFVHLDRVASPWLIQRFVDPQAEFLFVPWGREEDRPADAIAFGIPGVELGTHDADGTTFQKILRKYRLAHDAALERLGVVIAKGVDAALHGFRPAVQDGDGQVAIGLLALCEGAVAGARSDEQVLEMCRGFYDALYAKFRVDALLQTQGLAPPVATRPGPGEKIVFLRALLQGQAAPRAAAG
jgi:hypothetical protein